MHIMEMLPDLRIWSYGFPVCFIRNENCCGNRCEAMYFYRTTTLRLVLPSLTR